MKNHFQQICKKCDIDQINYISPIGDGKINKEDLHCESCGEAYQIIMFENMTDVNVILEVAGMALEDRNRHRMTGLPRDIWDSIKGDLVMFSDAHKAKIARNMALTFETA